MMIDELAVARAIHVLALVHWIGGLAVVTTIVLPGAHGLPNANEAVAAFEATLSHFEKDIPLALRAWIALEAAMSAPPASALPFLSSTTPRS